MMRNVRCLAALAVLLTLVLSGCGDGERSGRTIRGKLTMGGAPIKLDGNDRWALSFYGVGGADARGAPPVCDAEWEGNDGTYKATVPDGDYVVWIQCVDKDTNADKLKGAYWGAKSELKFKCEGNKSGVDFDVKAGE